MNVASWQLRLAGRDCAAGLAWTSLVGDTPRSIKREFQQALRAAGTQYGAIHKAPRYAQAGAARSGKKSASKLSRKIPVAAWLAESVDKPTIFVEHHDAGFWILVADAKRIDERGDTVVSASSAAICIAEIYEGYVQVGIEPDVVVADSAQRLLESLSMSMHTCRRGELVDLLKSPAPKTQIVKALGVPTGLKWAMAFAVVLGALAYTGKKAKEHIEMRRAQAELQAKRDAELQQKLHAEASQGKAAEVSTAALLAAATSTPSPHSITAMCLDAWRRTPRYLGGWKISKVSCNVTGQLELNYELAESGSGTEASFRAAAAKLGFQPEVDWFKRTAVVQSVVGVPSTRAPMSVDELPSIQSAGIALASRAQKVQRVIDGATFTATKPAPDAAEKQGAATGPGAAPPPPRKPFLTGTVRMSGQGLRYMLLMVPNDPYLSIEKIEFKNENDTVSWNAAGVFVTART